jgi:hypothetical protein
MATPHQLAKPRSPASEDKEPKAGKTSCAQTAATGTIYASKLARKNIWQQGWLMHFAKAPDTMRFISAIEN